MPYELGDDDRASSSSMSGSESDKSDGSSSAVSRQNTKGIGDLISSTGPLNLPVLEEISKAREETTTHQMTKGSPNLNPLLSIPASATARGSRRAPSSYVMVGGSR